MFLRQGCAFWGLEYVIFTFLLIAHKKIFKIKPEIRNFKPKCWIMNYKLFQKIRNRTSWKFNTKFGTLNAVSDAIWWRHNKFKVADGRHIENRFCLFSRRHIGWLTRNLDKRWRIICRCRRQFSQIQNGGWPHFKNIFIQGELPGLDQIWYADATFHSEEGYLTKNRNFANSRWRTDAILKIVFGYIFWYADANCEFPFRG